jgi:hypothetical protein
MRVTLLGVGEASHPNEMSSAVVVESGEHRVLINWAHSIPLALSRRFFDQEAIDSVVDGAQSKS